MYYINKNKFYIGVFILVLIVSCSSRKTIYNERYYQSKLCEKLNGKMEYILRDRTRVDCLTDEYAIEVDFAKKWAEGIGQSLYYAHMTHRKPAIGFIMSKDDNRFLKRLQVIADKFNIKIYKIDKKN
jgi:hypothetical protein